MLQPSRRSARRGIRAWWHEHVGGPLDRMYEQLDQHLQSDDDE